MKVTKMFKIKKLTAVLMAVMVAVGVCTYTAVNNTFTDSSITVSAVDNGTGTYRVNTASGLNIRSGPGTGYGKLGAAANKTQFTVTQTKNGWGYGTIRCTNGNKNGWACLQYCSYIDPSPETPLENGAYYWISPECAPNSVLDISEVSCKDGANLQIWGKVSGKNQKNQQFKAIQKGNYYVFEAVHSGKAIDLSTVSAVTCGNIHQWSTHWGDNQCWYLYGAGNGYYYIKSKVNTSFCMDVSGAGSANGTNVHLYPGNGTSAQKFKFTKVGGSVLEKLQSKFPAGKYWNHAGSSKNNPDGWTDTPCTHHGHCSSKGYGGACGCNSFDGIAIQCYGFAYKLGYDAYGSSPAKWSKAYNLNNLKAGDIVRYKNNGHSIFVTAVNGNTVTYGDCNSDGHCKIRWGQTISKSTLRATLTHVCVAPYTLS